MKTILVPIDFSRATKRVVAQAAVLAREFHGRLVLLNVTRPASLLADHAKLEEIADRLFVGRADRGEGTCGFRGDSLELLGDPVRVILDLAGRLGADYIVMGARGRVARRGKPVGDTAGGVLTGASCPVVFVPPVVRSAARPEKQVERAGETTDRTLPEKVPKPGAPARRRRQELRCFSSGRHDSVGLPAPREPEHIVRMIRQSLGSAGAI